MRRSLMYSTPSTSGSLRYFGLALLAILRASSSFWKRWISLERRATVFAASSWSCLASASSSRILLERSVRRADERALSSAAWRSSLARSSSRAAASAEALARRSARSVVRRATSALSGASSSARLASARASSASIRAFSPRMRSASFMEAFCSGVSSSRWAGAPGAMVVGAAAGAAAGASVAGAATRLALVCWANTGVAARTASARTRREVRRCMRMFWF